MDTIYSVSKYAPLVRSAGWFQTIQGGLQDKLLEIANIRRLHNGQCLFARGHIPDGVYCVVEGAVRIRRFSKEGREALLAIIEPPHWFGEIALFDNKPRTHDAWSEGPAVLLHLPQNALEKLLKAHPAYWREFGLLLTQKIREVFLSFEETAMLPAPMRLARRLIQIAEGYGELRGRSKRTIQISQEQLALMLSLSRQTANQILKQLESQQVIRLIRGGIEILDIEKLRALAA
jgi:CRP/FNR family transcriptional regulator, cyclic AMP receptor protein